MTRVPARLASALLALTAAARAQTPAPVNIHVDAAAPGAPLERVWAYHGYDEVNYTTTPQGRDLLRTLASAETAPVRVRTHFLFNSGDGTASLKWGSTGLYSEDANGSPLYDYTQIDSILDATIEAGAFPLFELGFMPRALSTHPDPYQNSEAFALDGGCFYPPRDYDRWAALVSTWAAHAAARYPNVEASWQWELWNEPDLGYWHGTFDEYAKLYDYTEAALHSVLPAAPLGGPAAANVNTSLLSEFLAHCATGTNAVSGRTGTRLDLVSFHAKGGAALTDGHVRMALGNQLNLHRKGFTTVAASSTFAHTPIVISEADPDGCAACTPSQVPADVYRSSPAYGAYEVVMMKRSLELANELGVELRGVLTWAFTFPGSPYFAGYRELATNGIHLPVLNAFKLLGKLGGERVPVASSGARALDDILANGVRQEPDVDALASSDGEQIRILVWNYHDDLVDAPPAQVTLDVTLPPAFGESVIVTQERVDALHGDSFSTWLSLGSPAAPSSAELAALRAGMEPVALEPAQVVGVAGGSASVSFELPRFGLALLTVTPREPSRSETLPPPDASCACRSARSSRTPLPALLALGFGLGLTHLRRRSRPRK